MNYLDLTVDDYCRAILIKINRIMEEQSIKQLELSAKTNISQSSLSKLLKGEMRLTLQHIYKISQALNLLPEELLPFRDSNTSSELSTKASYSGIINEKDINSQMLIRNSKHSAFNAYRNTTFYLYLYSNTDINPLLLEGKIKFDTKNYSFCKVDMEIDSGKNSTDGKPIFKHYSGELIVSLTMGTCYCILTSLDMGEICFLNFRHTFLYNGPMECRVGTMSTTSSGENHLPVIQRIIISKTQLNISETDSTDLEFIQGQLRLNDSKIIISRNELLDLYDMYIDDEDLRPFFGELFDIGSNSKEFTIIDESFFQDISVSTKVKSLALSILRNHSLASKYNKISSKADELVYEYITSFTPPTKQDFSNP